jgi:hypothetical protein
MRCIASGGSKQGTSGSASAITAVRALRRMSPCNVGAAVLAAPTEAHSDRLQIRRRGLALLATFEVEANLLALIEARQASALDRRYVDENIFRAIIRLNEAVSLLGIEPFDRAFRHRVFSLQSGDPHRVDRNAFHIGSTEVRRGRIGKVRETHAEKRRSCHMGMLARHCQTISSTNQGPMAADCCSARPTDPLACTMT